MKNLLRVLLAVTVFFFLLSVGFRSETVQAAWQAFIELRGKPLPASPAVLSEHEIMALNGMAAQQQAEWLLQRSLNHYRGAIELLEESVGGWRGSLLNSNDLRVRAAAIEVDLVVYNAEKTPDTVRRLSDAVQEDPANRVVNLWVLALLGSRGVETAQVEQVLLAYIHDPQEEVRKWAAEGLGYLGADSTIQPLLQIFRNDPSPVVRERAACSLASSGMHTQAQRMLAVPTLLSYMDNPALDRLTRTWVFQALRDISGEGIGEDPAAWRHWYGMRSVASRAR